MHQIKFALCLLLASAYSTGLLLESRNKRSTASFGTIVSNTLLKGAKVLSISDARVSFTKAGGYRQAVKDFKALKPEQVKDLTRKLDNGVLLMNGVAGNKGIQLVKGNEFHETMLSVFKVGDTDSKLVILYPDEIL